MLIKFSPNCYTGSRSVWTITKSSATITAKFLRYLISKPLTERHQDLWTKKQDVHRSELQLQGDNMYVKENQTMPKHQQQSQQRFMLENLLDWTEILCV